MGGLPISDDVLFRFIKGDPLGEVNGLGVVEPACFDALLPPVSLDKNINDFAALPKPRVEAGADGMRPLADFLSGDAAVMSVLAVEGRNKSVFCAS